jgi:hypothetical protein
MTGKKKNWEPFMTKFRDLVFIIMFLVTIAGWIITSTTSKTKMKMAIEQNTQVINDLKGEVNKINDYITKQSELNGQIIQFMSSSKNYSYSLQKLSIDSIYNNIKENLDSNSNKAITLDKGVSLNIFNKSHIIKNIKKIDSQQKQLEYLLKSKNKVKNENENGNKNNSSKLLAKTLLAKT